jgi:mono/diheme cytochrome c family protein
MQRAPFGNGSRIGTVLMVGLAIGLGASYLTASAPALRAAQASAAAQPTVWDGVFTTEQADRGKILFSNNCAECHGENLEGGEGKALSGDQFWKDWKESTVGELLTFVKTNMPFDDDGVKKGSLPTSTYIDIVTHILRSNGFPAGAKELTLTSGVGVQIIRKEGPGELSDSTTAHIVGCLAPREPGGDWKLVMGTRPTRASSPRATPDKTVPLGTREFQLKFVLLPLTKLVGHRVAVTGLLIGEAGVNGVNVSSVDNVADTCN